MPAFPILRSPDPYAARWAMLPVIGLGFVSLTLNWFSVAAAFPLIRRELHVTVPALALLISLFLAGYGLAHIPGGVLATRIGMKRTLVLGILLQGIAGVLSGFATNYTALALCRVLSGIGGSIFIAVAAGAVTVWFEGRELALALGISGGASFSIGAATGLYAWVFLQDSVGWRAAQVIAGAFGVAVAILASAAFRTPPHATALSGTSVTWPGLRSVLGRRDLWIYGFTMLGGYGAYFTTSQLISGYAVTARHFSTAQGGLLAALVGLAGIPGGVLGGWLADRTGRTRLIIIAPLFTIAVLLGLLPAMPAAGLWPTATGIGFLLIFSFVVWISVPGRVARISHENIGTAVGLMLTLAAAGGFLVPLGFGQLVSHAGFTAGWLFLAVVTAAFAGVGLAAPAAAGIRSAPAARRAQFAAGPPLTIPAGDE
jgi:ACS family D-galactonate transporter-like MFS transporter